MTRWLRPPDEALVAGHGPAAKRWEVRVCSNESARPSPPKPSAWALLSRKDGRGRSGFARAPLDLAMLLVMGAGQGPLLEQEAGDVGLAGGIEHRLHDDEQGHRQKRPGRPPDPGPEAEGDED